MCEKRAKMKVLIVLSMLVLAAKVLGADDGKELPRELCGLNMADARMLYSFISEAQKRYSESPFVGYPRHLSVMWPWMASRNQQQQQAPAHHGKRDPGLVDECYLKSCYMSELLNYC